MTLELAAENRWIGRHALVDALDAYVANMLSDKSTAVAANVSNSRTVSHNAGKFRSDIKPLTVKNQDVKNGKTLINFEITSKPVPKKCFRCERFSHILPIALKRES